MDTTQQPLVSIIVTVYNVEQYLSQCIRSVLRQTYRHIELILVNDASPDRSLAICQRFAARDHRIRIVDLRVNHGLNKARFKGLEVATGEYVMFVDSDDYIPSKAIDTLCAAAFETGADVVEGGYHRVFDKRGWIRRRGREAESIVEQLQGGRLVLDNPLLFDEYFISYLGVYLLKVILCAKLYKRELFVRSGVHPTHIALGEDMATNMALFPMVNRYVVLADSVYRYRYGGMTGRYAPRMYHDRKELYQMKKRAIEKYHYKKGATPIRLEMCDVLRYHLSEMYRYGIEEERIKALLAEEVQSGFVAEITVGVESSASFFHYLKGGDMNGFLECCRRMGETERNKRRWLVWLAPLLKWI
ncbi:MAG: glycosyltransferase [Mediterranea sp.]|jgi:glycosyltransferase involved in cell wall biosynthesis|nr:glycosyltransferase [Mediterranea sp.]